MSTENIPAGTVHDLPDDLKEALAATPAALDIWRGLTPLARNEWICWTTYPKQAKTREDHIRRVISELQEGMRRPCCWLGCIHRTDKAVSPSVRGILDRRNKA